MNEVAVALKPAPIIQLNPDRIKLSEYERQDWVANAEIGHTISDVMKPEYFSHKSASFKPLDHIEVRAEDMSWVAYLIIVEVDRNWVRVALDRVVKLQAASALVGVKSANFIVKWMGPQRKHSVLRVADNEIVKEGFATAAQAAAWLQDYEGRV